MTGMLGLIADQISQMRLAQYETIAPPRAADGKAKTRRRALSSRLLTLRAPRRPCFDGAAALADV